MPQINDSIFHSKELEKEQIIPKAHRRKDINITAEITETEKDKLEKSNKTKVSSLKWLLKMITPWLD